MSTDTTCGDAPHGAGLWCDNLSYRIRDKTILRDVSFVARPGELTVIMGPSGSGKTSLLNALLCRLRKGKVTGTIQINGVATSSSLVMAHAHYVMAFDVALAYLTVRETLTFTARLRMPGSSPEAQKAKVEEILRTMELEHCADTYVGGEWRKGISKGELKRMAIAAELLGDPAIVVLDEPTSGLDSYLALELVTILSKLARKKNKAIIASIHQPSQRAFELFDQLLLISNGGVVYHGPASRAVPYFATVNRHCPKGYSCPDYLLEVATDLTFCGARPDESDTEKSFSKDDTATTMPAYSTPYELAQLIERFSDTPEFAEIKTSQQVLAQMPLPKGATQQTDRMLGWREEFAILYLRSLFNTVRNPITNIVIVFVSVVQALVLGGLFWQLQEDVTKAEVEHTPISKWPLWENVVVEYLAVGIDREGFDPFQEIIESGVDGSGRQIAFDLLVNQDVMDWLGDVFVCSRNLYETQFFEPNNLDYPAWYWPPGSINGTANVDASRTADASRAPSISRGEIKEIPRDEIWLASPYFETLVSSIMAFMQMFDYVATEKVDWPAFPSIYDAGLTSFWTSAVGSVAPYVSPLLCCASMEWAASTTSNIKCTDEYPGVTFPEAPPTWLGEVTVKDTSKLLRSVGGLLQDFHEFTIRRKLKAVKAESSSAKPESTKSKSRKSSSTQSHSAPRRQLGSGLGGLATDLWSLIFRNPNTPVYALTENVSEWIERVKQCDNSYCETVNEFIESMSDELTNIAATFLTVLNFAGAIFFCVANLGFASYDVLLQFPKDRAVYNREVANGVHTTSPYFFAKICADLPFQLLPALLWSTIYYFMTGMAYDAELFFQYLGICLVVSFCAYSFGYMTSALSPRLEVAVIVAPLILVIMLVLAGFFIRDEEIPGWIRWFRHFSIYRHGFFATAATQFPPGGSFGSLDNDMILPLLGVTEKRAWVSVMILLALSTLYRLIAYLGLKYTNRRIGLEA